MEVTETSLLYSFLGLGKDAVMRPTSGEEETSAPVLKPAKDNKRKRPSAFEDTELKTRTARKPRKKTIPLTEESVRRLRDEDEEEEEENDSSILVAQVKKTIDAPKTAGSMMVDEAPPRTEGALALHQEAFSKSRAELSRCKAHFRVLSVERNALKLLSGQREEEIKDLRSELAKAHQDLTDLIEQSSAQARKIEELEAWLASELAKAKFEAEEAKEEAEAIVAVYRADAEAAQAQVRKAIETAHTRAYWIAELTKCQSRRETLEEIHARGFDLTNEIAKSREHEVEAGVLALPMMMMMMAARAGPRMGRTSI
ncbi:uncharacterized protein [Nicotiana tomentosiformis]|uniref:uncharacterized protein n=1 Tax=Nicotiana tomentosiformis TaxID=4098 RepID=UPI00388C3BC8